LPQNFSFQNYIDVEQEMWALFPETQGGRVNFCQMGLSAHIFVESEEEGDLRADETYFLMPCPDGHLRPVRMKSLRRLTLDEFRMSHLTAMKLAEMLAGTGRLMDEVHYRILGPGVLG
jgi:hypothetical protein